MTIMSNDPRITMEAEAAKSALRDHVKGGRELATKIIETFYGNEGEEGPNEGEKIVAAMMLFTAAIQDMEIERALVMNIVFLNAVMDMKQQYDAEQAERDEKEERTGSRYDA